MPRPRKFHVHLDTSDRPKIYHGLKALTRGTGRNRGTRSFDDQTDAEEWASWMIYERARREAAARDALRARLAAKGWPSLNL